MGGFATDDIGEVSGSVSCLFRQYFPFCNLAVEGWRQPGPICPCLGQRTLDMVKILHRPGTARCMERSFPTKRFRSFLPMCCWEIGMPRRSRSSWSLHSGRANVPDLVSMIHPKTSLTHSQFTSPAKILLTDTKSLASLGSNGGGPLESMDCAVKDSVLSLCPTCTAEMTSSM